MSLMLPSPPAGARRLTGILPRLIDMVRAGRSEAGAPVESAVLVLVDGLGRANLTARAGHARFLTGAMAARDRAVTVFPSTTATALTGLMTGVDAGVHGIVGYRVRHPGSGALVNQLTGWEHDGLDPSSWQRAETLFEAAAVAGARPVVVSRPEYRDSGFTRASFRGAEFVGERDLASRLLRAAQEAARPGTIVYAYAPELDALGHSHGWESDRWLAALETLDAAMRGFARELTGTTAALVTADHGMVDVPARGHVLLGEGDELLDGVAAVAGEPRMLHLYTEPGRTTTDQVVDAWRRAEGHRAWILTRAEAVSAGLFGARVDTDVAPRIGDVLVAARGRVAYYDDRLADKGAQRMVGQHGSLTAEETIVPLIPLGALARR
ncbi:alkaline phosphatase family protein [Microbacterium sp. LRZ72]|uniref:alkaline phosphatase family protein n=1 Tax=Microbacterium sp. LRZ72 TaxID=2942481 RepID=UPI0029BD169D|nr:alkaline phosphatase family protein [Microbacterium sp. LRZ72]MDX2375338.1 alkaline phosphatase family protein [Microbacterium sp. LRZ72]